MNAFTEALQAFFSCGKYFETISTARTQSPVMDDVDVYNRLPERLLEKILWHKKRLNLSDISLRYEGATQKFYSQNPWIAELKIQAEAELGASFDEHQLEWVACAVLREIILGPYLDQYNAVNRRNVVVRP